MSNGSNAGPAWVWFLVIIAIGVAAIVIGALQLFPTSPACWIAFGAAAVVSAVLAWATGASASPVSNPSFAVVVGHLRPWVWLVIFLLWVAAGVVCAFV